MKKSMLLVLCTTAGALGIMGIDCPPVGTPPSDNTEVVPPKHVGVTAMPHAVRVRWQLEPVGSGADSFPLQQVSWEPADNVVLGSNDTGTIDAERQSAISGDLPQARAFGVEIPRLSGRLYIFTITLYRLTGSDRTRTDLLRRTCYGAPAESWFEEDMARPGERLRLYESPVMGNCLMLTPQGGTRVDPSQAPTHSLLVALVPSDPASWAPLYVVPARLRYQDLGVDSSAMYKGDTAYTTGGTIPAYDFGNFSQSSEHLDQWYIGAIERDLFPVGRLIEWKEIADSTWVVPHAFIVKFWWEGSPRYARISFVGGLRGTAPNRYIELTVSLGYANVPFA